MAGIRTQQTERNTNELGQGHKRTGTQKYRDWDIDGQGEEGHRRTGTQTDKERDRDQDGQEQRQTWIGTETDRDRNKGTDGECLI
jgi:hypothetical protein